MKYLKILTRFHLKAGTNKCRTATGVYTVLIFVLMIVSCKKVNKTVVVESGYEELEPIKATPRLWWAVDSMDASVIIQKLALPSTISSTLDVDGDLLQDLRLNVKYFPSNGGLNAETKVETFGPETYILCDSVYREYHEESCNASATKTIVVKTLFPRALSYNDSVKLYDCWRKGNFRVTFFLETVQPTAPFCKTLTKSLTWPDNSWKYLAFSVKGRIGWIKMYSNNNKSNYYYELALANKPG